MPLKEHLAHRFVGSSRVARGWYKPNARTIEVEFVDGVRWEFFDCSLQTWHNFIKTLSPGRFIHDILNRHPTRSVR
jgi:hypothetical protein